MVLEDGCNNVHMPKVVQHCIIVDDIPYGICIECAIDGSAVGSYIPQHGDHHPNGYTDHWQWMANELVWQAINVYMYVYIICRLILILA